MRACSPVDKLFMLQKELKATINEEIWEFWSDLITDPAKITLNRDELTSVMLFIIARAEVPDMISQLRLMTEFTSEDIQDSSKGYHISEMFSLFFSTVAWMSQLDEIKLNENARSYLVNANVEILK